MRSMCRLLQSLPHDRLLSRAMLPLGCMLHRAGNDSPVLEPVQLSCGRRSSTSEPRAHHLGVQVECLLGKMFRHQVGGISGAQHFGQLKNPAELLFLEPQYPDI